LGLLDTISVRFPLLQPTEVAITAMTEKIGK